LIASLSFDRKKGLAADWGKGGRSVVKWGRRQERSWCTKVEIGYEKKGSAASTNHYLKLRLKKMQKGIPLRTLKRAILTGT